MRILGDTPVIRGCPHFLVCSKAAFSVPEPLRHVLIAEILYKGEGDLKALRLWDHPLLYLPDKVGPVISGYVFYSTPQRMAAISPRIA